MPAVAREPLLSQPATQPAFHFFAVLGAGETRSEAVVHRSVAVVLREGPEMVELPDVKDVGEGA